MSVSDVSGKAIANLATEELSHPAPVFHGDTLFVESEVLEKRESKTKLDRGTVKVHTRVFNQDGTLVAEFKRLVLVPRKTPGEPRTWGGGPAATPVERPGPNGTGPVEGSAQEVPFGASKGYLSLDAHRGGPLSPFRPPA